MMAIRVHCWGSRNIHRAARLCSGDRAGSPMRAKSWSRGGRPRSEGWCRTCADHARRSRIQFPWTPRFGMSSPFNELDRRVQWQRRKDGIVSAKDKRRVQDALPRPLLDGYVARQALGHSQWKATVWAAGEARVQLTWMDAQVWRKGVTARAGTACGNSGTLA